MYPRYAASPPRIAVGSIYLIADGSKVVADASVVVRAEGGAEGAGGGTLVVGATSGVWYYTPLQAETNYTAFTVTVYKADCTTATVTVVTTQSAVSGQTSIGSILGTALTETSGGYLAAAFKKLFDVATPLLVASDVMRGTDGANTVVPDAAGVVATALGLLETHGDAAWATATGFLDAAGVRTAVGLAAANLDAQLVELPTVAEFDARTLLAADYGTAANQATIAGYIDTEIGALTTAVADTYAAVVTEVAEILADTAELQTKFSGLADASVPKLDDLLNGTGAVLTLSQLRINSAAAGGAVDIDNSNGAAISAIGSDYGAILQGGTNAGLYLGSTSSMALQMYVDAAVAAARIENIGSGPGLECLGVGGDILADITGNLSGSAGSVTAGVTLTADERGAVAAALLDLAAAIDGKTPRETLRYMAAVLAGKLSGAGTGTETVLGLDGATERVVATVDASGNRTGMSYDPE